MIYNINWWGISPVYELLNVFACCENAYYNNGMGRASLLYELLYDKERLVDR